MAFLVAVAPLAQRALVSQMAWRVEWLSESSVLGVRAIIFGGLANFLRLRLDAQQFFGIVIKLAFCRTHCFECTRICVSFARLRAYIW